MIKVVHISTIAFGGAAIAALRLHDSLRNVEGVESYFLQSRIADNDPKRNVFTANKNIRTNYWYRVLKKLKLNKEQISNNNIRRNVLSVSEKYEHVSFDFTDFRVEEHPLIKDADIIHLHWVADFINYKTFFKKVKKPIVWTFHDMNSFQGLFHYKNDALKINNIYLRDIDAKIKENKINYIAQNKNLTIICLCNWMMEESLRTKSFSERIHHLIPNSIDFEKEIHENREQEKKRLELDNGLKSIIFVASDINNYRKGFDLALESLRKIKLKFNLITVGGNKINVPEAEMHLHFDKINNLQDLNILYRVSDLLLLTSREDNLPNILLESFAQGLPVISFNIGGMKDHIVENKTGFLIEPYDTNQLSDKLQNFILSDFVFDRDYIKNYAISTFDSKKISKKILELYNSLLDK